MKQHISPDQLKELTPEQAMKLREWWELKKWGLLPREGLPLISIGQMIELLSSKKGQTDSLEIHAPQGLFNSWNIWYANRYFPIKYEKPDLCDALWQAVKEVL